MNYISRKEAIRVVKKYFNNILSLNPDICVDGLKSLPGFDAEPLIHAHWIDYTFAWKCSNCHEKNYNRPKFKYCPYCGAKMDEQKGEQ